MVSLKNSFFKKDSRQKIITVKIPASYKKFMTLNNLDTVTFWTQSLPLETFLLINKNFFINFQTSTKNQANTQIVSLPHCQYFTFILFLSFNWNKLYYPIDAVISKVKNNHIYDLVISCFYFLTFLQVVISNKNSTFNSISTLYTSMCWVERELQEFNVITVKGLIDTRRLLTDYTQHKTNNVIYKTNSYALLTQDLYN